MIEFEDWKKLDIRIGEIKEVKNHPNADKLYILKVDVGEEIQIVAGIKNGYEEKDLIGKKIVVITNLKPVKLRGVESQGMLLAAVEEEKIVLLIPEKDISNGTRIE